MTFEQRFSAAQLRLKAARLNFHSARAELALAMKEVEAVLRRPPAGRAPDSELPCTFGNSPEVQIEEGIPHFYSEEVQNELS